MKKPSAINPWIYTNLDVQSKLAHVMGTPTKLPKCILGKRIFPLMHFDVSNFSIGASAADLRQNRRKEHSKEHEIWTKTGPELVFEEVTYV